MLRKLKSIDQGVWTAIRANGESFDIDPGEPSSLQGLVDNTPDGGIVEIPPGEYKGTLHLKGRTSLTLIGTPGEVWLVQDDGYKDVMIVEDCEDIHIQGLGMLHSSPGWCTGDALVIHNSRHLTVKNCDISGSGVVGVVATHSADLAIDDNHIHHCTYETIYLSHVFGVEIRGNLLRENEEQDTSEEGISVNQVHGKIEISGNTFVDNRSAPVTIYREKPGDNALPYGKILITKNIFSRSKSPHKQASIHDSCPDQDYCVPGMETVKITGNCFDMTRDRGDIHAHVSRGAETKDNRVVPLTLTGSFQVKYPKECTSAGAGVIPWLDKAREPTPE